MSLQYNYFARRNFLVSIRYSFETENENRKTNLTLKICHFEQNMYLQRREDQLNLSAVTMEINLSAHNALHKIPVSKGQNVKV